jgi:signal transduction histidine kinase
MQPQANESHVRLDWRLGDVPTGAFDFEAIHRAILNLVVNAIEALDGVAEAVVTVTTRYDSAAHQFVVEVADNGPGIAPEELSRLFNIFESTKGARGTGLGLAVSRKILKEHGGDLTVQSAPGRGAKFQLAWPRLDLPTVAN